MCRAASPSGQARQASSLEADKLIEVVQVSHAKQMGVTRIVFLRLTPCRQSSQNCQIMSSHAKGRMGPLGSAATILGYMCSPLGKARGLGPGACRGNAKSPIVFCLRGYK